MPKQFEHGTIYWMDGMKKKKKLAFLDLIVEVIHYSFEVFFWCLNRHDVKLLNQNFQYIWRYECGQAWS